MILLSFLELAGFAKSSWRMLDEQNLMVVRILSASNPKQFNALAASDDQVRYRAPAAAAAAARQTGASDGQGDAFQHFVQTVSHKERSGGRRFLPSCQALILWLVPYKLPSIRPSVRQKASSREAAALRVRIDSSFST
jgi:hypothetical protein